MKFVFSFLLSCSCIFAAITGNGAAQSVNVPEIPPDLVGKTIAWQLHWDGVENPRTKLYSKARFARNSKEFTVFVDDIQWVIAYNHKGQQVYPFEVNKLTTAVYLDSSVVFPKDIRDRAIAPFKDVPRLTVTVPPYAVTFKRISTHEPNTRDRLLACFKKEACGEEFLSYYKDESGNSIKTVRFGIAPVDKDFPVMMFVVEGVPYIGKVYFNTRTMESVNSEFTYIGAPEAPWRKAKEKVMTAILSEGDVLTFKDGALGFAKD